MAIGASGATRTLPRVIERPAREMKGPDGGRASLVLSNPHIERGASDSMEIIALVQLLCILAFALGFTAGREGEQ
jgi:hypothetical protein